MIPISFSGSESGTNITAVFHAAWKFVRLLSLRLNPVPAHLLLQINLIALNTRLITCYFYVNKLFLCLGYPRNSWMCFVNFMMLYELSQFTQAKVIPLDLLSAYGSWPRAQQLNLEAQSFKSLHNDEQSWHFSVIITFTFKLSLL